MYKQHMLQCLNLPQRFMHTGLAYTQTECICCCAETYPRLLRMRACIHNKPSKPYMLQHLRPTQNDSFMKASTRCTCTQAKHTYARFMHACKNEMHLHTSQLDHACMLVLRCTSSGHANMCQDVCTHKLLGQAICHNM
jgi:hypothetical protein